MNTEMNQPALPPQSTRPAMSPLEQRVLLWELTRQAPSVHLGLPVSFCYESSCVTEGEFFFLLSITPLYDHGWEYSFDILLHFWYCEMGCDPWAYELPEELPGEQA